MAQQRNIIALTDKVQINNTDLLGSGSTGNVYGGTFRSSINEKPLAAAIKAIPLETINTPVMGYLLQCQIQAMKLLSKTKNPYIVMLYDVIFLNNYVYIVMEKLNGGTLRDYMNKYYGVMQKEMALQIFAKIIEGYSSISANKIIHRDLKPQNIIFRDKNYMEPCIIDFGYCVSPQVRNLPNMHYNVGSPKYMSPEAYQLSKYSEKSDIWALGVVLYQMFVGKAFDQGIQIQESLEMLARNGVPYPPNFDLHLANFLNQLLIYNLQKRVNFSQVRESIKNNYSFQKEEKYVLNPQNSMDDLQISLKMRKIHTQGNIEYLSSSSSIPMLRRISSNTNMNKIKMIVSPQMNKYSNRPNENKTESIYPISNRIEVKPLFQPIKRSIIQQKKIFVHKNIVPNLDMQRIISHQCHSSPINSQKNLNQTDRVSQSNFNNNEKRETKVLNLELNYQQSPRFFQPVNHIPILPQGLKRFNIPIHQEKSRKFLMNPNFTNENNLFKKMKAEFRNPYPISQYRQLRKVVKIN